MPGDLQLDTISGNTTFDAAILEFDFVPISDTVKFNYVFASEEYPEYSCCTVNDVFGFFISGPGIVGAPNIALIPSSTTPVTVNTLTGNYPPATSNCGGGCYNSFSQYYIDNAGGLTVQYDAFSTVLEARQVVIACDTFHIKLAIADAGDGIYDSGVFLQQGSFSGGSVFISSTTNTPDSTAIEGCADGTITFTISAPMPSDDVIYFTVGGTATNGIDYTYIPDSVIIPTGQTSTTLTINPLWDGITEPLETVVIAVQYTTSCSTLAVDSVTINITNVDTLHVIASNDTTICS